MPRGTDDRKQDDKGELEGTRERGQGNLSLKDKGLPLDRETWHTGKRQFIEVQDETP